MVARWVFVIKVKVQTYQTFSISKNFLSSHSSSLQEEGGFPQFLTNRLETRLREMAVSPLQMAGKGQCGGPGPVGFPARLFPVCISTPFSWHLWTLVLTHFTRKEKTPRKKTVLSSPRANELVPGVLALQGRQGSRQFSCSHRKWSENSVLVANLIVFSIGQETAERRDKPLTPSADSGFECQPGHSLLCVLGQMAKLPSPRLSVCKMGMSQRM